MSRTIRLSADQAGALGQSGKKPGRGRYGAKKTVVDGITFDSKAEARRYGELMMMRRAGEIYDLEIHRLYPVFLNGKWVCDYTADFCYRRKPGHERVVEDVKSKGTRTARDWPLRKRLVEAAHTITITEVVR